MPHTTYLDESEAPTIFLIIKMLVLVRDLRPQIWSLFVESPNLLRLVQRHQICLLSHLPLAPAESQLTRQHINSSSLYYILIQNRFCRIVTATCHCLRMLSSSSSVRQIDLISGFRENYRKKVVCHLDRSCRFQRQNNCRSTVLHLIQPPINGHQTFNPALNATIKH